MTGTNMDAKLKNEMIKMAKAMKMLSGSNLAIYDAKIDIDSINDDHHYLWALRKTGTILVNLSVMNVCIEPAIATNPSNLFFFHVIDGNLLLVTRTKALHLINQALR